ncbi:thiol:disulfide interchange protein [Constrictibacter sp. MBR-5]|jgi:hypothetical protein|uniref:PLDc N-terminal domain-containing protein n=1 Tax=Constrictibacter sp. MBR-5 TaxID=3156467 RepID=UPI003398F492
MEFILGIVLLALNIWAIVNVVQSTASTLAKVLWVLFILIAPVLGFIVWLIAGPRGGVRSTV